MEHRIAHGLSDISRARAIVDQAFESYSRRLAEHEPRLSWTSDREATVTFRVMGKTIRVHLSIDEKEVTVSGKLPLVFRPFQGKILGVLEREVETWLAKARAQAPDAGGT